MELLLSSILFLYPVNKFTLSGYVYETKSKKPVSDVFVSIGEKRTLSLEDGFYYIDEIPPGTYTLYVVKLGYQTLFKEIQIDSSLRMDIYLKESELISSPVVITETPLPSPEPIHKLKEEKTHTALSSAEIIDEIPNISLSRAGSWGIHPVIQGLPKDRITVISEGAKVNSACPMGMDACVASVSPVQMEEVEVIEGPNTLEYGGGNIGGTIVLKNPLPEEERFKGNLSLGWNSVNDGQSLTLKLKSRKGSFAYLTSAGYRKFNDYRTPQGIVPFSNFKEYTLNAKVGLLFKKLKTNISYQGYFGRDIGWAATRSKIPEENRHLFSFSLKRNPTLFSTYYQRINHSMVNSFGKGESNTNTYGSKIKTQNLFKKFLISYGLEYRIQEMDAFQEIDISNDTLNSIEDAQQKELFAHISLNYYPVSFLSLQGGGQTGYGQSHSKNFPLRRNLYYSYNTGIGIKYRNYWNAGLFFARGAREPSPVELYVQTPWPDGYLQTGNYRLNNEISYNLQFKSSFMWNLIKGNFSLFFNRIKDFIVRTVKDTTDTLDLKGTKVFENIPYAITYGGSFSLGFKWKFIEFHQGFEFTTGKNHKSLPLPQIPPVELWNKLVLESPRIDFSIKGRYVFPQNSPALWAGEEKTSGWTVFDISSDYRISRNFNLRVEIENLLNRYYREHLNLSRLPEPGRNIKLYLNINLPLYLKEGKIDTLILKVNNMACSFCAGTIENFLMKIEGIQDVQSDLKTKRVTIIKLQRITEQKIIEELKNIGYEAEIEGGD